MRLLTLPFRYWWVTLVTILILTWPVHLSTVAKWEWNSSWLGVHPEKKRLMLKLGPNYQFQTLYNNEFQICRYGKKYKTIAIINTDICIPMVNKLP